MLEPIELLELENSLKDILNDKLASILSRLNRTEELDDFLKLIGEETLLQKNSGYHPYTTGKIVVIGESAVKKEILIAIARDLGVSKDRLIFHLSYDEAKRFQCHSMQYNPSYSVVIFGPVPHSGKSKGDYGSIISEMEHQEGYPPIIRMTSNSNSNDLKITKSSFREQLGELIEQKIVKQDMI